MSLDLYSLEVFCQVMQDRTFSAAAKSLKVSQPTVSQQIAKLESRLNQKLFQRVGHEVLPTPQAEELLQFAQPILEQVEGFEERMAQNRISPRGLVRYGMPESCQWTPHFRRVMAQTIQYPELQFKISVLTNEQILLKLLEGELDFGFVVGDRVTPELRFEKYCDELYSAVAAHSSYFRSRAETSCQERFRWITYPGWEQFFTIWAKAHGLWNQMKSHLNEPSVHIGTLAGAIHAVQEGAGVAIIPTHCLMNELESTALVEWKPKEAKAASPVYIARRVGEKLPHRAELVIDLLKKSKAGELWDA